MADSWDEYDEDDLAFIEWFSKPLTWIGLISYIVVTILMMCFSKKTWYARYYEIGRCIQLVSIDVFLLEGLDESAEIVIGTLFLMTAWETLSTIVTLILVSTMVLKNLKIVDDGVPDEVGFMDIIESARKDGNIVAENRYQDVSAPFFTAAVFFTGQSLIASIYMDQLSQNMKIDSTKYMYWCVAVFIQVMNDLGQFGNGFESELVYWIVMLWDRPTVSAQRHRHMLTMRPTRLELSIRCFFSLVVNLFFRTFVIFSVPIMLIRQTSSMDVIMNATAMTFITSLDDLGETQELRKVSDAEARELVLTADTIGKGQETE